MPPGIRTGQGKNTRITGAMANADHNGLRHFFLDEVATSQSEHRGTGASQERKLQKNKRAETYRDGQERWPAADGWRGGGHSPITFTSPIITWSGTCSDRVSTSGHFFWIGARPITPLHH